MFAPTAAADVAATLTIDSNDFDQPSQTVALSGRGLRPHGGVTPATLELGTLLLSQTGLRAVVIGNLLPANVPLQVTGIAIRTTLRPEAQGGSHDGVGNRYDEPDNFTNLALALRRPIGYRPRLDNSVRKRPRRVLATPDEAYHPDLQRRPAWIPLTLPVPPHPLVPPLAATDWR